ncbi:hypothetical protein [Mesorhizobium sp. M0244]|uniref:hypothetical protein n=1 Tax=unclassified Mesorhizobium TaxID=325217 RepID=UPI00333AD0D0
MSEQVELISAGFIEEADIERVFAARGHIGASIRRVSRSRVVIGRTPGMSICSPCGVGSVAVS